MTVHMDNSIRFKGFIDTFICLNPAKCGLSRVCNVSYLTKNMRDDHNLVETVRDMSMYVVSMPTILVENQPFPMLLT